MNFTFEGNFKPRRNINLGGIKKVDDKRSLLAKAQSERKAREQERLKQKSAQHIQVNWEADQKFILNAYIYIIMIGIL